MRSGSIFEMQVAEQQSSGVSKQLMEGLNPSDQKSKVRKWLKCSDHEVPISVDVDLVAQRVFTITGAGLFTVFDVLTFDIICQKEFRKTAQNLISFKMQNKVMLVFEGDIVVLDSNFTGGYDELREYELRLNKISDAKLNQNEKVLGVASLQTGTPEISLYETENGFAKLTTFDR